MKKLNFLNSKAKQYMLAVKKFFLKPTVKAIVILVTYTLLIINVSVNIDRNILTYKVNKVLNAAYEEQVEAGKKPVSIEHKEQIDVNGKFSFNVYGCVYNKKITPSSVNYNSYYANNTDGNIYLDTIVDFVNNTDKEITLSDVVSANVEHGSNNYTAICAVEINDNTSFEYAAEYKIKPKEAVRIHFISDIPAYIEKDATQTYTVLTVDNRMYKLDAVE